MRADRHFSIAERIIRRSFVVIVATVLLVIVLLFLIASYYFRDQFDAALLAKARALVTLTKQRATHVELDFADEFMPEFDRGGEKPEYFQIWLSDGSMLEKSRSLGASVLPHPGRADLTEPEFADLDLADGRAGRTVSLTFVPQVDDEDEPFVRPMGLRAALVVARSREELDRLLWTTGLVLFGGSVLMAGALCVLLRWTLRSGLRPLDALAGQIRSLQPSDPGTRIRLDEPPVELEIVVAQLNRLLDRLEDALAREARFTADAAHELRTPLAELRTLAEVATRHPDDEAAIRAFFGDVGDIARQMEALVTSLLALARSEGGESEAEPVPVDLRAIASEVGRRVAGAYRDRAIVLHLEIVPPRLIVLSDPDALRIVIGNLLENAYRYAPVRSVVGCASVVDLGGEASLIISNPAPELTPADVGRMFDRFWRKDQARTSSSHGGLGLALVRTLAERRGLAVRAELAAGILRIRVSGFAISGGENPRADA